jgi:hypothetical protein
MSGPVFFWVRHHSLDALGNEDLLSTGAAHSECFGTALQGHLSVLA